MHMKTRLSLEPFDSDLRRKFKVWCINHKTTMREKIEEMIRELLEKED